MSIYDFTANSLQGREVSLGAYQDRVLLIVNVASKCGLTPQYRQLQSLYTSLQPQGLEVLGFPCNQFGGQEPGASDQIASFCEINYGVSFPMFEKVKVNGADTHPLFAHLKSEAPGLLGSEGIKWNFTKFLVDRQGNVVRRYAPKKLSREVEADIRALL